MFQTNIIIASLIINAVDFTHAIARGMCVDRDISCANWAKDGECEAKILSL